MTGRVPFVAAHGAASRPTAWRGSPWILHKPPLFDWLGASAFALFGPVPWAARRVPIPQSRPVGYAMPVLLPIAARAGIAVGPHDARSAGDPVVSEDDGNRELAAVPGSTRLAESHRVSIWRLDATGCAAATVAP